jgi:hypothetical protein
MDFTKDAFDFVKAHTPLGRWLEQFSASEERKRLLESFSAEIAKHPEEESQLLDYFQWNDEAALWKIGDGDVCGTSYAEFVAIWSDPSIYRFYEAALLRYQRSGGTVHRTIVVGDEYFNPDLRTILLRTAMRQTILGFEPLIAHRIDVAQCIKRLGVNCDMLGVANNRIGYFIRLSPAPCMVRTTNKHFIGRAWDTYQELAREGSPFEEWLRGRSFHEHVRAIRSDVELEAELIWEFAEGPGTAP